MSNYGTGEELIKDLVQQAPGFAGSVAQGSWRGLNTGRAAKYAIMTTRPGERVFDTPGSVLERWETIVQIWKRYIDDGSTYTGLGEDVAAVIEMLDQYPHLGDTSGYVEESTAQIEGEVKEMWTRGRAPAWLRQDITVRWTGRKFITFLD